MSGQGQEFFTVLFMSWLYANAGKAPPRFGPQEFAYPVVDEFSNAVLIIDVTLVTTRSLENKAYLLER